MRRMLVLLALLLLVAGTVACTTTPETTSPAAETGPGGPGVSEAEEPAEEAVISLADGWTIDSIITAADVGAITGRTMAYFPEAASAAQDGKPKAGYTNEGQPNTKLYVAVDVAGGEDGFEKEQGFADPASIKELSGVGDQAVTCAWSNGNVGVIVLKGDAVIRIDWPKAVYGDDAEGMGSELANLLIGKMFE